MVQEELFKIEEQDLLFLKNYLQGQENPVKTTELARQLVMFKTESDRQKKIKIYNPECSYEIGDLIYKEYSGKLPVGNKKFIELEQGVVLKVVELRQGSGVSYIKLIYEGSAEFRKHIDYLTKQKIELLLPHKMGKQEPEYLQPEDDPRREEIPVSEKDLSLIEKKLISAISHQKEFVVSSGYAFLKEKLTPLPKEIVDQIKEFFQTQQQPVGTEFLVQHFLKKSEKDEDYQKTCFNLNFTFENFYKVVFKKTRDQDWGKWFLISELVRKKRESLVAEPNPLLSRLEIKDTADLTQKRKQLEHQLFPEGENRHYLTLREIFSGALRLKYSGLKIPEQVELDLIDTESKKEYQVFYYKDDDLLFGLDAIYELHRVVGGTVIALDLAEDGKLNLSVKQSKKGIVFEKVRFDSANKRFELFQEQQFSSSVMVNKNMFLEAEELKKLNENLETYRQLPTLNKLVQKIFLDFGDKTKNYELHVLKLYHLVDTVFPLCLRTIEDLLLGNSEFVQSEKLEGVFYLDSEAVNAIEAEERLRREKMLEEARKRREEERLKKIEEEKRKKEEIRRLREERRKKREQEMWLKEKSKQKKIVPPAEKTASNVSAVPEAGRKEFVKPKVFAAEQVPFQEKEPAPRVMAKKTVKKERKEDNEIRPAKKSFSAKRSDEDLIEIEEIKKEVLSQPDVEKIEKKKEVEKEIVYQDRADFGGVFARKLESIISKEEEEKTETDQQKKDKTAKKKEK